jgi:hypothetical protein
MVDIHMIYAYLCSSWLFFLVFFMAQALVCLILVVINDGCTQKGDTTYVFRYQNL